MVTYAADLKVANNLSDLQSAASARANLGLGSAATASASAFDSSGAAAAAQAAAEAASDPLGSSAAVSAASVAKSAVNVAGGVAGLDALGDLSAALDLTMTLGPAPQTNAITSEFLDPSECFVNGRVLARIFSAAKSRRIDFFTLTDSNGAITDPNSPQVITGDNLELTKALAARYGIYASGITIGTLEGQLAGLQQGYVPNAQVDSTNTTCPTNLLAFALGHAANAGGYPVFAYTPPGYTYSSYDNTPILSVANSPSPSAEYPNTTLFPIVAGTLTGTAIVHVRYGLMPGAGSNGGGSFYPTLRPQQNDIYTPFYPIGSPVQVSCTSGSYGMADWVSPPISISCPSNNSALSFYLQPFDNSTARASGQLFITYERIENATQRTGIALSTFYQYGGHGFDDAARVIAGFSANQLGEFLRCLTSAQYGYPMAVAWITMGGNDWVGGGNTNTSTGPLGGSYTSGTPQGIVNDARQIIGSLRQAWTNLGSLYLQNNLMFIIGPNHPEDTDEVNQNACELALASLASEEPDTVACIRGSMLTSPAELISLGGYLGQPGTNYSEAHMSQPGYQMMANRSVTNGARFL